MDYFDYKTSSQLDPNPGREFDIEEFLEQSRQNERHRLEDELEEIEKELDRRDRIHEETIDELESQIKWYLDRLKDLYNQRRGKTTGEREKVKTRIKEFYQEIREEKQSHWQDHQQLQQEKRKLLREINELDENWLEQIL